MAHHCISCTVEFENLQQEHSRMGMDVYCTACIAYFSHQMYMRRKVFSVFHFRTVLFSVWQLNHHLMQSNVGPWRIHHHHMFVNKSTIQTTQTTLHFYHHFLFHLFPHLLLLNFSMIPQRNYKKYTLLVIRDIALQLIKHCPFYILKCVILMPCQK